MVKSVRSVVRIVPPTLLRLLVAVGLGELVAAGVANAAEASDQRVLAFTRVVDGQARLERDRDENVQDILVDGRLFKSGQLVKLSLSLSHSWSEMQSQLTEVETRMLPNCSMIKWSSEDGGEQSFWW